jgi:bacterioferritin (cytochrome b1)
MEQILGEFATEEVKRSTLLQLETSMKEEQAAIDAYRRRADYARRGFPVTAIMLDHIREEEEEHLREIRKEIERLQK